MASSSSRTRSRSRPPSPYSSASSTCSSHMNNNRLLPRSSSTTSASTIYNSAGLSGSRSMATSRSAVSDPGLIGGGSGNYKPPSPVTYSSDGLVSEPTSTTTSDRHSISVTVRFRPMSEREYQRGDEIAWYPDADKMVRNEYNPLTAYAFDKVFGPQATTIEVYDVAAKPVVKAAMEGVNGTVFAYGVTSSGKTHTMHGDQDFPGIIPLAIKDVFSIIQETTGREFLLRVSYLEIYNEVINDLLDPTGQNLRIREDSQGTYVEGIKEEVVLSPGHALSFIAAGEEHRHVGSNNFNLLSSRSHTIFTLMIESSAHGDQYDGVIFSQLNLIDLAGSESSKTETTGLRRKEGSFINKSLLTLGTVIGKLTEGKTTHVPFRDSKLTRLLQSSLSGHGHVSLICTVTPASSSSEETHNTLKFASRAKRIEINASRNKIIDEKSLIKKYQKEISTLKVELEQLRRGVLVGVSHEELLSLRQQLQEGQVKMQSRLEEEEEAKAALMSRIQKLTKLILVSTKSSIPGYIGDAPSHQRSISAGKDDLDSLLLDGDNLASPSSTMSLVSDASSGLKHRRSSSKLKDENSPVGFGAELSQGCITPDEMDLLAEQVKMLAGEIAFSKSTLKRLVDQSVNDPENSKPQIQSLEREIQEKQTQMRSLEQRITESGEGSIANASFVEMQQKVTRLMTQCNEKNFELEIISADNRILQEQLEKKCTENNELHEKVRLLEQRQSSQKPSPSCSGNAVSEEYVDELKKKVQSQEIENEKLKLEHVQSVEEMSGLRVQNQKLAEEASYAKELASAAAIELKNLADEVTKLSLQNAKLEKELVAARDLAAATQTRNNNSMNSVANRNGTRPGRKARITDSWNLNQEDLKMELQARKQREAVLEATLAEKQCMEEEYRKKTEEAKRREEALENDLANMWVLVAKLKKASSGVLSGPMSNEPHITEFAMGDEATDLENESQNNGILKERQVLIAAPEEVIVAKPEETPKEEPLVARLKARMQEMKEKEMKSQAAAAANADANSHVCKVCFESPTATILLPCRHFCLCKCCSLACSECPICRTNISDRLFAFPS
ncbi:kinesin-like protein KIN-7M, chloroplastic isoform X2 [Raphanus sativus]|uniref:Kinesin-like protein KIN-7M, chloroplastic isoform X2 n=1 Tax=Raphanus sativus TaxID=3726 RepID=A0A6J0JV16_RAPSA|nr:kinesin-like protein KIN-7M, chloroplastic isoform X2 [Raphanus sativus]